MNKAIVLIVVLTVAAGGGFFLMQLRNSQITTTDKPNTIPQPTQEVAAAEPIIIDEDLAAGGSSYLNSQGIYTFLYPNDYTQDAQNDGQIVRIYKHGATQKGQTEMYDGALMVFEVVNLEGKTMEEWVDSTIQSSTADGTSELTAPKVKTTINSNPAFSYKTRGLGESQNIVVQKENSELALHISILVADPQQVGFQAEVDKVLNTLQIMK